MAIDRPARGADVGTGGSADRSEDRGRTGGGDDRAAASRDDRVARALGWLGIARGVAAFAAPRELARLIGIRGNPVVLRALGVRDLVSGVGIVAARRPAGWLWARVGGDVIDLALLVTAIRSPGADPRRAAAATAALAGMAAMDVFYGQRMTRRAASGPIHVRTTLTVNRKAEELYRTWRDIQSLPRLMSQLESVHPTGPNTSRWTARAPAGGTVEWDAEIVLDRPNEIIAWRSLPGAPVDHRGSVRFRRAPGGRGTEVTVELEYKPPGGPMGATVAQLLGPEPGRQLQEDLRRFKRMTEAGEVPTTEGQPSGPPSHRLLRAVMGGRRRS